MQVYKGVLRETGELVAVKVQRPGIGESIAVDMLLLRRLMAVVDKNLPQVGPCLAPWLPVSSTVPRSNSSSNSSCDNSGLGRWSAAVGHQLVHESYGDV
jgi:hypothetical protein